MIRYTELPFSYIFVFRRQSHPSRLFSIDQGHLVLVLGKIQLIYQPNPQLGCQVQVYCWIQHHIHFVRARPSGQETS